MAFDLDEISFGRVGGNAKADSIPLNEVVKVEKYSTSKNKQFASGIKMDDAEESEEVANSFFVATKEARFPSPSAYLS